MIIGARLKKRIDAAGTTQAALAGAIGVSPQAVSKMVTGGTTDTAKLYQIARFLKTSPEYLTGEADDPLPSGMGEERLPFRGLAAERDPDLVDLDEIDLRFGLGGTYLDSPVTAEKRQFSRTWLRHFTHASPEHLFWSLGDGDSMEPTIRSGELILIDRSQDTPRFGDGIWAVAFGEIGMVKRLRPLPDGSVEIHSDNPIVRPALASDGELHVIGRVVAVVRKL